MHPVRVAALFLALVTCNSCGLNDFRVCPPPPAQALEGLPPLLSATGLYQDIVAGIVAPGVSAFTPRFELWTDGASKRRWIWLPPGSRIDTSDMDAWQFPAGTKLWKEFTRDGVRVETRLLQKLGPAPTDWVAAPYVWDATGQEARIALEGVPDALGTPHDVPSASDCTGCHGGRSSRVLGFSAVQLAHDAPPDELDLQDLIERQLVTDRPTIPLSVPGNPTEQAALGYLHANCGHCHNQARPGPSSPRCYAPQNGLDFWLSAANLTSPASTPTYRSAVGGVIKPGRPGDSELIRRIESRSRQWPGMPPLGSEQVDQQAVVLLRRWIEGLSR